MPPKRIPVPKTPKEAHNPNRRAGTLLRSQVLHLHEALKWHVAETQAALTEKQKILMEAHPILAINPKTLHTEGAISNYIQKVTALLHPQAARRQVK